MEKKSKKKTNEESVKEETKVTDEKDYVEEDVDVIEEEKEEKEEKTEKKEEKQEEKKETKEEKLEKELNDQKEKYMRLCAEYDNYRKRTQNEKLSIYDDATKRAVSELLPIADSISMALTSMDNDESEVPESYKQGIELIGNQLKTCFEKLDIEEFANVGDDFDPELHNAISKIEDENLGENKISAVFQKGFKLKDKIVRHAMVQVANCD